MTRGGQIYCVFQHVAGTILFNAIVHVVVEKMSNAKSHRIGYMFEYGPLLNIDIFVKKSINMYKSGFFFLLSIFPSF